MAPTLKQGRTSEGSEGRSVGRNPKSPPNAGLLQTRAETTEGSEDQGKNYRRQRRRLWRQGTRIHSHAEQYMDEGRNY